MSPAYIPKMNSYSSAVCEPTLILNRAVAFYLVESARKEHDRDSLLSACLETHLKDTRNLVITSQHGVSVRSDILMYATIPSQLSVASGGSTEVRGISKDGF